MCGAAVFLPVALVGVSLIALGVVALRGLRRGAHAGELLFGLAIAGTIAGYTLVDKEGLEHAGAVSTLRW